MLSTEGSNLTCALNVVMICRPGKVSLTYLREASNILQSKERLLTADLCKSFVSAYFYTTVDFTGSVGL